MERFRSEYNRIMLGTRFLSQLGAFLIIVLAIVQVGKVWGNISEAVSEIPPDLLIAGIRANVFQLLVLLAFGIRFIFASKRLSIPQPWVFGSWFLALAVGFLYFAESQFYWLAPFRVYGDCGGDPLERAWILYLTGSTIRFVITAAVAYIRTR